MDILKRLIAIFFNVIKRTAGGLYRLAGWLLNQTFGEIHWQAPQWVRFLSYRLSRLVEWFKQNPTRGALSLLVAGLIMNAAYFGWRYYESLPKPVVTSYQVTNPAVSSYDDNGKVYPQSLVVTFNESVAPVSSLNHPIQSGIKIKPKIAGDWVWDDDKTLRFTPKSDWPVDAEFTVSMDKKQFFAPQIKLEDYAFTFKSAPFSLSINSAEFYQDPIDANLKKLVAIVHFSHPVDTEVFKQHVALKLGGGLGFLGLDDKAEATISFDKFKLNAYVHSAPLAIPKEDTSLKLTISKGVTTSRGGNASPQDVGNEIVVPGLYSLKFDQLSMTLVDNERFEPEQILIVGSTRNVSDAALKGHVSAWLLPEFNPKTSQEQRTQAYGWYSDEVTKEILAQSEPLNQQAIPSAENDEPTHSFKFKAPVGRRIYVKVDAGIQAFGGYLSQTPALAVIEVQPYPQAVKLLSEGALLSLSGEKKLAFMSRGIKGVKVDIGRVLPHQLHHLIDQNHAAFATPNIDEYNLDTLVERFEDKRPLPVSEFGKPSYDSIDFGRYLKEKSSHSGGVFMVQLNAYDPDAPENSLDVAPDTRFILVTDLGIVAKKSVDGSQDVYVQSISTGLPISGAKVEVIGRNGQAVMSETTTADGHVHLQKLDELKREKQALMYVVSKDTDLSFLPINRYDRNLDVSRFDIGGIDNATSAQQLTAYGFTDRGIYRPGETAHIGLITRTANWAGNLTGLPLEAEITDPRGLPVFKKSIRLNASGFESLDFTSRETSATGEYHVGLYVVKSNIRQEEIGSTSFKVRDFEPDRLKVNVTLANHAIEGWIKPEEAVASVKAMHLFGSPANDRRVTADMTLTPSIPVFAKYQDYRFQERYKLKDPFTEKLAEATTDANGETKLELNLKRFSLATYRLYVSSKVYESAGGRGVTAEAAALVSSAPYLVGTKVDGQLNYISRNAERNTQWLAIDPALKPVAVNQLNQVWIERKFISVLVKQANGTYKYESRKKEIVRESLPYSLKAEASTIALNTKEPGDFALALRDADGNELNRVEYSVAGQANLSRSLERNAELQLTLNKKDYVAGEPIEISIRAPYVGAGLITIERDHVFAHQWFKTDTTSSVQKITIPKDFEGNGYISVQFVRDAASDEIFMSPLSYGVAPFAVNMDTRREPVNIQLPDIIKPGQTLSMKVNTAAPSKVVVFAVDEGILQVGRYKTPDPIGFFFQKRALQVDTTQILDLILPEFKQLMSAAAPGGDADAVLGRHLNPFKKKHQPPVAYWSGVVEVDSKGKTLQYAVPESFNGKLRVFAVAINPSKIGVFEGGSEVRGDLIVSSNVPAVVAPGDEFTVSVSVFNNIKGASNKTPVQLTLKNSAGLSVVSAPKNTLQVQSQQEASAEFVLRANQTLGASDLQFIAQSGVYQGKALDSISVRPASAFATQISVGQLQGSSESVPLTRQLFAEKRDVYAGISSSPLVWVQGLNGYLAAYEYACTEQLVSKNMPSLVLPNAQALPARNAEFEKTLEVLRERQNSDGSFGLWSANLQVAPFTSVYATHYLIEAKERGFSVPSDMLNNANQWLSQLATGGSNGLEGARTKAYAIYLLTKQGIVTSGMLATLQKELNERYAKEWPQDLTAAYMAASYRLMQQDALANQLLKGVPWKKGAAIKNNDDLYYSASVHDAKLLYITAKHFKERIHSVPKEVIHQLGEAISQGDYHTLSAAYMMLGFDAYGAAGGQNINSLNIAELDSAGKSHPLVLKGEVIKYGSVSPSATTLTYSQSGKSPVFYMLSENGFDRKTSPKELSQGLEIAKVYTDLKGAPISEVKVGDEFLVKLTFRATERDKASQVAVVDLLPGGIEPVITNTAPEDSPVEPQPQAQAVNENVLEGNAEGEEINDSMETTAPTWQSPLGESGNTWQPEYADIRDDRVILYGNLSRDVGTFVYRVRATNAGKFAIPAPFAEGMYQRKLQARGKSGILTISKPK